MNEQAENEKTIEEKLVVKPDAEESAASEPAATSEASASATDEEKSAASVEASDSASPAAEVEPKAESATPETQAEASSAQALEGTAATSEEAKTSEGTDENKGKRKPKGLLMLLCFIWVPLSFIIPYSFTHHQASQAYFSLPTRTRFTDAPDRKVEDTRNESIRSGLVGMIAALAIFAIWQLDKMNSKEKGGVDFRDKKVAVIMVCLAGLLWLVWTAAGHIVLRVNDEVYDVPPQLPGLEQDE